MRTNKKIQGVFVLCLLSFTITFGSKNIQAQCIADFVSDTSCAGMPTQFTDLSTSNSGPIASWAWDFGDGGTSIVQNPVHIYTAAGTYATCLIIETSLGCSDTTCHSVIIYPPFPSASFSASPVCDGDTMCFTDLSTPIGGISTWFWDFGDGSTSSLQDPCHQYAAPGTYNVSLTVTNSMGCSDAVTIAVEVYPNPVADFSYTGDCDFEVTFTDLSIANAVSIVSWSWDFGDGVGTSTVQNPTYTYATAGAYNVCLTVVNSNGCIDSSCSSLTVYNRPISDFTYVSDCDLTISFTDMSVVDPGDTIMTWSWDFGDGSTSYLQNPVHTYGMSGNYTVSLTVMCQCMAMDTSSQIVTAFLKPEANFATMPVCDGDPMCFTDLSIANPFSINSWVWSFGDGSTSNVQNPCHLYPTYGVYYVSLTVSDTSGCIDDTTMAVEVFQNLSAAFSAPDTNCSGSEIQFTDQSVSCCSCPVISWTWDFGDGTTSFVQNPLHLFVVPGVYQVSLTVTADSSGITITDQVIQDIMVHDGPEADFTNDNGVCPGYPLQFTSSTTYGVISYYWEFGDGYTSYLQHPTHIYQSAGDYTVSLTVTDTNGCTDIVQHLVNINEPDADFSYIPVDPNPGDTVFFTDLSSSTNGYIIQWTWYFGDGDSTTVHYPDNPDVWHIYSDSGNFIVELYVIDNDSCSSYTSQNLLVFAGSPIYPIADYNYNYTCLNQFAEFFDLSSPNGGSPLVSWSWDFGDGGSSNLQNPAHLYTSPGNYDVSLVVTNADNLSDTIIQTLFAHPLPDVSIIADPGSSMTGYPIQFYGNSNDSTTVAWVWSFGDGSTSVLQNPTHIYQDYGTYNVSLTVTNTYGCMNTATIQLIIYTQPAFPEDSTIWNTVGNNVLTNQTWRFRYGMIGDTTISTTDLDTTHSYSKVYSLVDSTLSNPNSTYFAAIRNTEDKKVYALIPGFEETLLYDFSLEVGDTIWYSIGGSLCYNAVAFTEEDHYKVVTGTDSLQLENGEFRKRLFLTDYPNGIMNDEWVEGVGSIVWYGLFNPLINDMTLCGDGYDFACMKKGKTVVYLNNPHCDECFCQLMTSIEDILQTEYEYLLIYPNPATNLVTIKMTESNNVNADILIYNSMGQCVYQITGTTGSVLSLDVGEWEKGVYLVKFVNNDQKFLTGKFIVN